ncbi:MAG: hypothetical protein J7539_00455 [Niabella sp.]|nr:hypothetical protein [Niabella sp.]
MKIGVYSKEIDRRLLHNVNNLLIVNSISKWQPSPEIMVFCGGTEAGTRYLAPSIERFPLKEGLSGWLGPFTGQRSGIARLLQKKDIDALLLFDVKEVLNTSVPQFLLLDDRYEPEEKDRALFQKLAGIAVSSEKIKTRLIAETGVDLQNRIVAGGITAAGLKRTAFEEQLQFREAITAGKEFFICTDDHWTKESLVLVLKAFSQFKKMQQTHWKLVLTQRGFNPQTAFGSVFGVLSSYKYKEDVVLFEQSASYTYAQALGAAYAAVSTKTDDGFPAAVAEAIACGTTTLVPDPFTDATFPVLPAYLATDETSLGAKMMELYKNESLRHYYIEAIQKHAPLNTSGGGLKALLGGVSEETIPRKE